MARIRSYLQKPHTDVKTTTTAMIFKRPWTICPSTLLETRCFRRMIALCSNFTFTPIRNTNRAETQSDPCLMCAEDTRDPIHKINCAVGDETFELFIV